MRVADLVEPPSQVVETAHVPRLPHPALAVMPSTRPADLRVQVCSYKVVVSADGRTPNSLSSAETHRSY